MDTSRLAVSPRGTGAPERDEAIEEGLRLTVIFERMLADIERFKGALEHREGKIPKMLPALVS